MVLVVYTFCVLWGFGAVFGSSLAAYAPVPHVGPEGAYRIYVVLFALIVVPLSTLHMKEQAAFQVSSAALIHLPRMRARTTSQSQRRLVCPLR